MSDKRTALCALIFAACFAFNIAAAEQPASMSDAYLNWLSGVTEAIEANIDLIVQSAEDAAKPYTETNGYRIGAAGDVNFVCEAQGRSGGLMRLSPLKADENRFNGVVIYALNEGQLENDIERLRQLKASGTKIVLVSRTELLQKVAEAGVEVDWQIPNGNDRPGFIHDGDDYIIPMDTVADVAVLWTWTAEFVAACTRNGKMPPMFQGYAVPGGQARARRIGNIKFHSEEPIPAPAGQFGPEFLRFLRRDLERIRSNELDKIREAARRAVAAKERGNALYIFPHNHTLLSRPGTYRDPGYFTPANLGWWDLNREIQIKEGDFFFCVGFDSIYIGGMWRTLGRRLREAGAQITWSFTGYKEADVNAVLPEEIWINQHWDFGDAVVEVPGYDIKICPTSGILGEAIMWMVHAEMDDIMRKGQH